MVTVKALMDFAGSAINRDELGVVRKGQEIEVSANDAAYLERDGLVKRVAEKTPAAAVAGDTKSKPGSAGETPDPASKSGTKK